MMKNCVQIQYVMQKVTQIILFEAYLVFKVIKDYNEYMTKQKIIFKDDYPSIFSDFDKMFRVV